MPRIRKRRTIRQKKSPSVRRKKAVPIRSGGKFLRYFHARKIRKFVKIYSRNRSTFPIVLCISGVILLSFPSVYRFYNSKSEVNHTVSQSVSSALPFSIDGSLLSSKVTGNPPQRIVIPKLAVDLPVVEANIINGFWELSEKTASHGKGSGTPGQRGNIVIFAHAREGMFLPLRDIKQNEVVYILTKSSWHAYRVTGIKTVTPDDIEVIRPTAEETLTLFTCSGFLDTKRLIVTARPLIT